MDFAEHLQRACEYAEAAFHFEEGGCFAMAMAIHAHLGTPEDAQRYAVLHGFVHAYAVVDGAHYDYTGESRVSPDIEIVSLPRLIEIAGVCGHGVNDLDADMSWASEIILAAVELSGGKPGERPRASDVSRPRR